MDEGLVLITERADYFPEDDWLTKSVLCGVIRGLGRWLTDNGEPLVEATFDLHPILLDVIHGNVHLRDGFEMLSGQRLHLLPFLIGRMISSHCWSPTKTR